MWSTLLNCYVCLSWPHMVKGLCLFVYTTSSLHMLSPFREEDDDEYCFVSRGQGLGASVDCQVFNCLSRWSLRGGCSIVLSVRWIGSLFSLIDDSDFVLSLLFINFQSWVTSCYQFPIFLSNYISLYQFSIKAESTSSEGAASLLTTAGFNISKWPDMSSTAF